MGGKSLSQRSTLVTVVLLLGASGRTGTGTGGGLLLLSGVHGDDEVVDNFWGRKGLFGVVEM